MADKLDPDSLWSAYFDKQLTEMRQREPNENAWRQSKTEPIPAWNTIGPQFVQSYIDWRQRAPWQIWTTPDGQPAIELDVSGFLPGCPVEIKAYLDRVFHDPVFDQLWIVDLKSGKRTPKTGAQFETYAALLKAKYGVEVRHGTAFMNRQGTPSKPFDLSKATPETVGEVYGKAWEQIQKGDFPANGFDRECFICDVSAACYAKNGPLAAQYDPAHPEHPSNKPPF